MRKINIYMVLDNYIQSPCHKGGINASTIKNKYISEWLAFSEGWVCPQVCGETSAEINCPTFLLLSCLFWWRMRLHSRCLWSTTVREHAHAKHSANAGVGVHSTLHYKDRSNTDLWNDCNEWTQTSWLWKRLSVWCIFIRVSPLPWSAYKEGGRERGAGDCRRDWRAAGVASAEPRDAGSVAGERHWAARDGTWHTLGSLHHKGVFYLRGSDLLHFRQVQWFEYHRPIWWLNNVNYWLNILWIKYYWQTVIYFIIKRANILQNK